MHEWGFCLVIIDTAARKLGLLIRNIGSIFYPIYREMGEFAFISTRVQVSSSSIFGHLQKFSLQNSTMN